jgi:hypothetical protein
MSVAKDLIKFSNLAGGVAWTLSGDGAFVSPLPTQNSWSSWRNWYIYSPCFIATTYATYRFLNQPKMEIAYYYATSFSSGWTHVATRTIEGNSGKRESVFGHNVEVGQQHSSATNGGSGSVYFDFVHGNNHLWLLRVRKYRNKDWGWGQLRIANMGYMGEQRYNDYFKGKLIRATPKTALSSSTSLTSNSVAIYNTGTNLQPSDVSAYLNPDLSKGSPILSSQDWRLLT